MKKITKKKTEWYPVIDYDKCISCLACVDKCTHNVYSVKDGKPKVISKTNCLTGCKGCEPICPVGAITHFSSSEINKGGDCNCEGDCTDGCDCK